MSKRPHLKLAERATPLPVGSIVVAKVREVAHGKLVVLCRDGLTLDCEWLETSDTRCIELAQGDTVVVLIGDAESPNVVMGRVGRYDAPSCATHVKVRAAQSLTLECGEASIAMRADGKVMIRGDDVLVRAKGTKRIRAATVSIN